MTSLLCFAGVLLFLLGLLTGFAIPAFKSPRIGLSAHLAATQSGIALVAFGWLWTHLDFWSGWSVPLAHLLWISLYLVWGGIVLGAIWGTGRSLPIAGAGHQAPRWQERAAFAPIALGSFGALCVVIAMLVQWRWVG